MIFISEILANYENMDYDYYEALKDGQEEDAFEMEFDKSSDALAGRRASLKLRFLPQIGIIIYRMLLKKYGKGAVLYIFFQLLFAIFCTATLSLPLYNTIMFALECDTTDQEYVVGTFMDCLSIARKSYTLNIGDYLCGHNVDRTDMLLWEKVRIPQFIAQYLYILIIVALGLLMPVFTTLINSLLTRDRVGVSDYTLMVSGLPPITREQDLRHYIEEDLGYKGTIRTILIVPDSKELSTLIRSQKKLKEKLEDIPFLPRSNEKIREIRRSLSGKELRITELLEKTDYKCSGRAIITFNYTEVVSTLLGRFHYGNMLFYHATRVVAKEQSYFYVPWDAKEDDTDRQRVRFRIHMPYEPSDYQIQNFRHKTWERILRAILVFSLYIPLLLISVWTVQTVEKIKTNMIEPLILNDQLPFAESKYSLFNMVLLDFMEFPLGITLLFTDYIMMWIVQYLAIFRRRMTHTGEVSTGFFMSHKISLLDDNMVFLLFLRMPRFLTLQRMMLTGYMFGALFFSVPYSVIIWRVVYGLWYKLLKTVRNVTGLLSGYKLDYPGPKRSRFDIVHKYSTILSKFYFAFTYSCIMPIGMLLYAVFLWIFIAVEVLNFALGHYKPMPEYNLGIQRKIWRAVSNYTETAALYTMVYYSGVVALLTVEVQAIIWYFKYCEGVFIFYDSAPEYAFFSSSNSSIESSSSVLGPVEGYIELLHIINHRTVRFDLVVVLMSIFVIAVSVAAKRLELLVSFLPHFTWRLNNGRIVLRWKDMPRYDPAVGRYSLFSSAERYEWDEADEIELKERNEDADVIISENDVELLSAPT